MSDDLESDPQAAAPVVDRPVWDPHVGRWVAPDELSAAPGASAPSRWGPALIGAIAGAVLGAIVAVAVAVPIASRRAPQVVERRLAPGVTAERQGETSVVQIASRARPWVVNVSVTAEQRSFGRPVAVQGLGSGVIIRSDGHVITNAHVVDGASAVEVTLASGEKIPARIVGSDPETDVAVVKVDRSDLPAAVVGTAKDLEVGEVAVAIGSPLGLEQSVTAGIISALGRRVDRPGESPLLDMIQTDAPVTQGNSGGALLNGEGALIGITTAIAASPEVGAEGIAFATPIDVGIAIANELIRSGRATHPWLGISGGNIEPEVAREFGVEAGALVVQVVTDAPADRAGIRAQDVIVRFDGQAIESMDELVLAIRERRVGERVRIDLIRDGRRVAVTARLGDKPANL